MINWASFKINFNRMWGIQDIWKHVIFSGVTHHPLSDKHCAIVSAFQITKPILITHNTTTAHSVTWLTHHNEPRYPITLSVTWRGGGLSGKRNIVCLATTQSQLTGVESQDGKRTGRLTRQGIVSTWNWRRQHERQVATHFWNGYRPQVYHIASSLKDHAEERLLHSTACLLWRFPLLYLLCPDVRCAVDSFMGVHGTL